MKETSARRTVAAIAVVVGMTTAHVWSKVEMASAAGAVSRARARVESLEAEQAKLVAAVALQSRPTLIQRRAEQELGMVFPSSVVELEGSALGDGN